MADAETRFDKAMYAAAWMFFGFVLGLLAALEWAHYMMTRGMLRP